MWALGVLLFALLAGYFPFKGSNEKELYGKIQIGHYSFSDGMSKEVKYLI